MTYLSRFAFLLFFTLSAASQLGCDGSSADDPPDAETPDAETPDADTLPEGACATNDHCGEAEYCALEPEACAVGSCAPVIEPTAEPGARFEEWERWPCVADSCNCSPGAEPFYEGLFECEAVHNGFFWTFGSVEIRVMGRHESGDCIWEVSHGTEGEFQQTTCRVPMPAKPWPGLFGDYSYESPFWDGFPGTCDEPTSCCVLDDCPNPCEGEEVDRLVCFRFPRHTTPCDYEH